jgi:dinuclear metal center YbgI/SA1388 family protein
MSDRESPGPYAGAVTMHLGEFLNVFDLWYPSNTALKGDPVGLVWGDQEQPLNRVMLAVDPVQAVADEAVANNVDLLLVHHPLLLRPVSSLPRTWFKGRVLHTLAAANCALLTAHTNADQAAAGVSAALAEALGVRDAVALVPHERAMPTPIENQPWEGPVGLGRLGDIEPQSLSDFAQRIAGVLPHVVGGIKVSGAPETVVSRVALCGGAGDSLLDVVAQTDADVYLTSDLRHHVASEFREQTGKALIDVAHWAAESIWLPLLADRIAATWAKLSVVVSQVQTDPWDFSVKETM